MIKRQTHFSNRLTSLLLVILIVVASMLLITACGSQATTKAATTTAAGATTGATTVKTFTAAELAAFDGKNGAKAYIAVDGIVYDVTAVTEWGSKLHAGKFVAGKDYSVELKSAPHGVSNLLKAVKVGELKG